jgi:hypothetical protein
MQEARSVRESMAPPAGSKLRGLPGSPEANAALRAGKKTKASLRRSYDVYTKV